VCHAQWSLSALTGLGLLIFCYDLDAVHALAAVAGTWLLLALAPRRLVAPLVFVFNLGYLLAGYWAVATADGYDIDWTMAHCVLTLRLIGLGFDYGDGGRASDDGSAAAHPHRLVTLPSPLETLGFAFHWAGLMVGPQYPLAVYRQFVVGPAPRASPWVPALQTFLLGMAYLGVSTVGTGFVPTDTLRTDAFAAWSLGWRVAYMWAAYRLLLVRYAAVWLLTDGHCILSGLGYNGVDAAGRARWDRVSNILPARMVRAASIGDYVSAFNVNTNAWVKEYVFKRLRFLGNRQLSSAGALLFLAIWHGVAPGYFITFGLEFVDALAEDALVRITAPLTAWAAASAPLAQAGLRAGSVVLANLMLSFGLVAFEAKTLERTLQAYHGLMWIGVGVPLAILFLDAILAALRPPPPRPDKVVWTRSPS
jgi:lysophospholipid acyltransferase 5